MRVLRIHQACSVLQSERVSVRPLVKSATVRAYQLRISIARPATLENVAEIARIGYGFLLVSGPR